MKHAPRRVRLRREHAVPAATAVKCAVVATFAFLAVSAAGTTTDGVSAAQDVTAPPAGQARLDKLIDRHDCSPTGFGADVIPGSSLVLQDNKVKHVSFDEGWAVYTGDEAGTLLAVCRVTM
ncbi:hypothetical protein [Nocardioides sp.]|uniref:hypothetical protein n=1 Tax=Nocardioides sp. TaxID=35761 RepID=UPI00321AFF17